jgi:hypothetical protein
MTTDRSGAILVFRKWFEESTPLHCTVTFKALGVDMQCTVTSISDEVITAMSDDRLSIVRVTLDRAAAFGYGDTRIVPGESEDFKGALVVLFGASDDPACDLITFIERRVDS